MSVRSWDKKRIRKRIYILPHPILMVDVVHVIGVGSTIGEGRTVGRLSGCNACGILAACTCAPKTSAQKSWDKFEIRVILKGEDSGRHECVYLHDWRIQRDIYMLKLMACTQYRNFGLKFQSHPERCCGLLLWQQRWDNTNLKSLQPRHRYILKW